MRNEKEAGSQERPLFLSIQFNFCNAALPYYSTKLITFISMKDDQINYILQAFYFKLLVAGTNGNDEATFEDVSGLDVKIETETIEEGGENQFDRRVPKQIPQTNLVLNRGMIDGSSLMAWINATLQSLAFTTRTLTVILLDEKGKSLASWTFYNAYPVAVKISDIKSSENKYFIQTLEFAYSYFERTDPK